MTLLFKTLKITNFILNINKRKEGAEHRPMKGIN